MNQQTKIKNLGNLGDLEVLEILQKIVQQENVLFEKAKAEGHEIEWDENSTYFLYFGELLEEMGPEKLVGMFRDASLEKRREYLNKFLKFNEFMGAFQAENPGKEIWFVGV